jgi:hypothetical protein
LNVEEFGVRGESEGHRKVSVASLEEGGHLFFPSLINKIML